MRLAEWVEMLRGKPPKPPWPDSPRSRYLRHLRDGSPPDVALSKVAESYGLEIVRTVLRADGSATFIPIAWTIKELYAVHFARYLFQHRILTDWPEGEPTAPPIPMVRVVDQ